jgi:para-nitrobenzyl esterase
MPKFSRRAFLLSASPVLLSSAANWRLFAASGFASEERPVVETKLGKVQGVLSDGTRLFKGVPFAQPPVGPLRFRAPEPPQPWSDVRPASDFAKASMQPPNSAFKTSEDCLYLNIWAPEEKGSYPVFVYIHGGGFTGGRSFDSLSNGSQFAKNGIVCVTVAYRLGALGFLDVGPLLGAAYAGSANNALRDLIASLEWIKQNIEAFGGDPKRVTIGGESAGAKLTCLLMGVPSAQDLFHGMISESGGAERILPAEDSEKVARGYNELWTQTGAKTSDLLSADAASLIAAQKAFMKSWPQHFPLRPEIDGSFVSRLPIVTIAKGSTRGKRLLLGTNRDESALFLGPHPKKDAAAADLGNLSLNRFDPIYAKYSGIYPQLSLEQRRIRAVTAEEYWIPSLRVAEAHVRGGGEAYMYRLDFSETSGRFKGYAYHSLDSYLVWDDPHKTVSNAEAEAALAGQMHDAWSSFIKGDAPKASGLPDWPRYTLDNRATMLLDIQSRVEQKPDEEERLLWDGVL